MDALSCLVSNSLSQFPEFPSLEHDYVSYLSSSKSVSPLVPGSFPSLSQEIEKARQHIKASLDKCGLSRALNTTRIDELEQTVNNLIKRISDLEEHIGKLKLLDEISSANLAPKEAEMNGDAGCDLFKSDDEDDVEAEELRVQRLAEYNAKKSQKPAAVSKSAIVLDIKPWGDDTDLHEMERLVRSIEADGLLWGQSKLVPLAYGIRKLQISCVVEDDKVGTDFLEEAITQFQEYVQSVDIASFNKV